MKAFKAHAALFLLLFAHISTQSCYRKPRTFERKAMRINQSMSDSRDQKRTLINTYELFVKENHACQSKTLTTILSAVLHKNRNISDGHKIIITNAINTFYNVEGFDKVLFCVFNSIISNNKSNFNGALGELTVALKRVANQEKIIAFNREIKDESGRIITDIDVLSIDPSGKSHAIEVKARNDSQKNYRINKQQIARQQKIAREAGWKHELIRTTHNK